MSSVTPDPLEDLVKIGGVNLPEDVGPFVFEHEDFLLYGLLLDPVYMPELLWKDPANHEFGGQYRVRDYQYIINRLDERYAIVSCARSVGKTESEKVHAEIHLFKEYDRLLITAPELIHLLPLTDAIEDNIQDNPLLRELLDLRNGQTGFQHRPFQCNLVDGTKIVGRIPKRDGPQPLTARILTPAGWTTMGEIGPGERVIGASGRPTRVLGVTNTWMAPTYRVEFSDGTYTHTDAHHRWRVRTDTKDWHVVNTQDLADALDRPPKHNGGVLNMFRVPAQPIVEYDEPREPLIMDAYLLGALLGDGAISQKCASLTSVDPEVLDEVSKALYPGHRLRPIGNRGMEYLIVGPDGRRNDVIRALRELELLGHTAHTKYIPERYKRAGFGARLAVLNGLLDTDGSAKHGGAHLVSASRTLVEDAAEVCRSLGGWASVGRESGHSGGTYWRVTLRLRGHNLFRLSRKAAKYRLDGRQRHRSIRAVIPLAPQEVRCIKVEAADESYLTDHMLPTLNTGVKAQHQKHLIVEEGQDYPERGWKEVNETVNYDSRDRHGKPDFSFWIYGVHSGNRASQFDAYARSPTYRKIKVTALRRPDWGPERKANAVAAFGGSSSPDYKRNILGEPGAGANAYFVTARVMACVDQNVRRGEKPGSEYNENTYVKQTFRAEEMDELGISVTDMIDLPRMPTRGWWLGGDIGLTDSPTVLSLFAELDHQKKKRIALVRKFTLERFRPKQIRETLYAIGWHFGSELLGVGIDVTGLGKPIFQDMEDDELCPPRLKVISSGFTFNSKVEIGVAADLVTENQGVLRDHLGNMVKVLVDEMTGEETYVVMLPFIAASTRMIADEVDSGTLLLPFDIDVTSDMLQETKQRVERVGQRGESGGGPQKKGDRFHILDSFRAAFYRRRQDEILEALASPPQESVLEIADDRPTPVEYTPDQLNVLLGLGE